MWIWARISAFTALAVMCGHNLAQAEPPQNMKTVIADPSLDAVRVHRWMGGTNYRALWTSPIQVEVLDLKRTAGGLTPMFRVGGLQTHGLAMRGNDGKSYTFRGLVKSLSESLPPGFEGTAVADLVQDALSAAHPGGALVVPVLAQAVGILHTTPRLVIIPDEPALGEFRADFALRLGTFEEYPTPASPENEGFGGATEIVSTEKLWPRIASGDAQIDAKAFLKARLLDFLVGDWDRHAKQFRWAKLPGNELWQPLPEDRDWAFSDYEGAIPFLLRPFQPTLIIFGEEYPSLTGLTLNGSDLIRWILPTLEKSDWEDVAAELQLLLDDTVLEAAVGRLPKAWHEQQGSELVRLLAARRASLPAVAGELYRFLAAEVDVHGTEQTEHVVLRNLGDGALEVTITRQGELQPEFRRIFSATETRDVRIYLRGGEDRVSCIGEVAEHLAVRLITSDATHFGATCSGGVEVIRDANAESIDEALHMRPDARSHFPEVPTLPAPWSKPRDYGYNALPALWLNVGSDYGLLLGGGVQIDVFGFMKAPYASRHLVRGGYAFGVQAAAIEYLGEVRFRDPRWLLSLGAVASGIEVIRFYGFGNETSSDGADAFFRTEQMQYKISPSLRYALTSATDVFGTVALAVSDTRDDADTLLNTLRPYGVGDFGQVGAGIGLETDTRDATKLYGPGVHLRVEGNYVPEVWNVDEHYAWAEAEFGGYVELGEYLLLATRVQGKKVFGQFPFHDAAFVGGSDSVRGYRSDRFAGHASVFGNLELRLLLGEASFLLPAEYGLVAFGDAGRVFAHGERSRVWHPAVGGGAFASIIERSLLANATLARSDERTVFFLKTEFVF